MKTKNAEHSRGAKRKSQGHRLRLVGVRIESRWGIFFFVLLKKNNV